MKKTIENILPGESLLTSIKKVKNGKVKFELVSYANRGAINLVALFNKGDERFNGGNVPRRAWQTAEPSAILNLFGVDVSTLVEGESVEVNLLNPCVPTETGAKAQLFVEVMEYAQSEIEAIIEVKIEKGQKTASLEYLIENSDKTAKINPSTKEPVLVNNELVFSITRISAGTPKHKWVSVSTPIEEVETEKEAKFSLTQID
jgi:hypothetical protein